MPTLGQTIAIVRKEKKLSQIELSQKMHVTQQTVSSWETDKIVPNIEVLKRLSCLLEHDFVADHYNIVSNDISSEETPDVTRENIQLEVETQATQYCSDSACSSSDANACTPPKIFVTAQCQPQSKSSSAKLKEANHLYWF